MFDSPLALYLSASYIQDSFAKLNEARVFSTSSESFMFAFLRRCCTILYVEYSITQGVQEYMFISDSRCVVCHAPDPDVDCLVCQAPHHASCWRYNDGHCSIFGCCSVHNSSEMKNFQDVYRRGLNQSFPVQQVASPVRSIFVAGIFMFLIGFAVMTCFAMIAAVDIPDPEPTEIVDVPDVSDQVVEQLVSNHLPTGLLIWSNEDKAVYFNGHSLVSVSCSSAIGRHLIMLTAPHGR